MPDKSHVVHSLKQLGEHFAKIADEIEELPDEDYAKIKHVFDGVVHDSTAHEEDVL